MIKDNRSWKEKEYPENGLSKDYVVKRYRPRVEGGFSRIEKISHTKHGVYWKVTTRDNIATIFGRTKEARIADPMDASRIFQWMLEFSYDDKGNWIRYEYKKEDLVDVPDKIYEKNRRSVITSFTNSYLVKIRYGNQKSYYADSTKPYDPQVPIDYEHFFEVVLDYGTHDKKAPASVDNEK